MLKICSNSEIIEIIKNNSILLYTVGDEEFFKLPHYAGYILIRLAKCDNNSYLNICKCQRHDIHSFIEPKMWAMVSLERFYNDILRDYQKERNTKCEWISYKDLKRAKAKKINNRWLCHCWFDSNGVFYLSNYAVPNKKKIEYHKELIEASSTAVYVRYRCSKGSYKMNWFANVELAIQTYEKESREKYNPLFTGNLEFKILKLGYNELHPMDKKYVIKLPYFNLEKEITKYSDMVCVITWLRIIDNQKVGTGITENTLLELISAYQKYKEKQANTSGDLNG